MKFDAKEITLKNGKKCVLRPTMPRDAKEMLRYLKVTSAESEHLLRYPDEVSYTLEGERDILKRLYEDPRSVMMLAEIEGKIAGNCSINGFGDKRKICHRSSFAIALYKDFWGMGIGSAMTEYACELARKIGFEQVELEVVEENTRGRALYAKCGFVETGKIACGFKYDDGSYSDLIVMSRRL